MGSRRTDIDPAGIDLSRFSFLQDCEFFLFSDFVLSCSIFCSLPANIADIVFPRAELLQLGTYQYRNIADGRSTLYNL